MINGSAAVPRATTALHAIADRELAGAVALSIMRLGGRHAVECATNHMINRGRGGG
jgi:hypothetical protein